MECENHIGVEVKRLDNEIHSRMAACRALAGATDMTRMHGWIIGFLYRNQSRAIFQKDIEAEFSIARSTATGILQLMERKGFIRRQSVERDARLKEVILTEEGARYHLYIQENINRMETLLRKDISQEELDIFMNVIRRMRMNVEMDSNETDRRRDRC